VCREYQIGVLKELAAGRDRMGCRSDRVALLEAGPG
jgi:hypothetical protein